MCYVVVVVNRIGFSFSTTHFDSFFYSLFQYHLCTYLLTYLPPSISIQSINPPPNPTHTMYVLYCNLYICIVCMYVCKPFPCYVWYALYVSLPIFFIRLYIFKWIDIMMSFFGGWVFHGKRKGVGRTPSHVHGLKSFISFIQSFVFLPPLQTFHLLHL